jgi:hypothetical protein
MRETDVLADDDYFQTLINLKNAVLGAIEQAHPDYEQKMAEFVQEALAKSGDLPAMTPDEFCEWLSSISDSSIITKDVIFNAAV